MGITTCILDLVSRSFTELGIELAFEGENENQIAKVVASNYPKSQLEKASVEVRVEPQYYRPTEVD